ncbi:AAEL015101-PA, partial [Aedes aegypti]
VCSKVFGNASALAKHKLTHSDERKYVCGMCSKAFKRQDHLNGHMLTHRNKNHTSAKRKVAENRTVMPGRCGGTPRTITALAEEWDCPVRRRHRPARDLC